MKVAQTGSWTDIVARSRHPSHGRGPRQQTRSQHHGGNQNKGKHSHPSEDGPVQRRSSWLPALPMLGLVAGGRVRGQGYLGPPGEGTGWRGQCGPGPGLPSTIIGPIACGSLLTVIKTSYPAPERVARRGPVQGFFSVNLRCPNAPFSTVAVKGSSQTNTR